eukprot:297172-Pelagomonas_calceolata.AAC.6
MCSQAATYPCYTVVGRVGQLFTGFVLCYVHVLITHWDGRDDFHLRMADLKESRRIPGGFRPSRTERCTWIEQRFTDEGHVACYRLRHAWIEHRVTGEGRVVSHRCRRTWIEHGITGEGRVVSPMWIEHGVAGKGTGSSMKR